MIKNKYTTLLSFLLIIFFLSGCNNKPETTEELNKSFFSLSENEKRALIKEMFFKSSFTISKKYDIPIPENSIFFVISDTTLINTLGFKKFFGLPIIIRFSDRPVVFSGNTFAEGGLDRRSVGRAYDYGNYRSEGKLRDIHIYHTDIDSPHVFSSAGIGYHTNNLGRYEVYNFEEMEGCGLAGLDIGDALEYLGKLADDIASQKTNLNNNNNFFFYNNNSFTDKFNGVYLDQRPGLEAELKPSNINVYSENDSLSENYSEDSVKTENNPE
jgi:hypothetical protein